MAQSDIFVILTECDFEKNGYQNRYNTVDGKWITRPVNKGSEKLVDKRYSDNKGLVSLNMLWIKAIKATLGIDTVLGRDFPTDKTGTARLIEICQKYKADEYLTNMEALDKYLDKDMFEKAGIKIIPFKATVKKPIFWVLDNMGIEGARKSLCKT